MKKTAGHKDTRAEIFDVALRRLLQSGPGQLSMRQIALEVGITPMAIYRHFPNKEALQCELVRAAFEIFTDYLKRSNVADTPRTRLLLMADGFFDFALENSAYFELLFLTSQTADGLKGRDVVLEVSSPSFDILHDCARSYLAERYDSTSGSKRFAQFLLATSVGFAALYVARTFGWDPAEAKARFREGFMRAIDLPLNPAADQDSTPATIRSGPT